MGGLLVGNGGAEILLRHFPNDGNDRGNTDDNADDKRAAPQPPFHMLLCGRDYGKRFQADRGDSFADFGVIVEHWFRYWKVVRPQSRCRLGGGRRGRSFGIGRNHCQ